MVQLPRRGIEQLEEDIRGLEEIDRRIERLAATVAPPQRHHVPSVPVHRAAYVLNVFRQLTTARWWQSCLARNQFDDSSSDEDGSGATVKAPAAQKERSATVQEIDAAILGLQRLGRGGEKRALERVQLLARALGGASPAQQRPRAAKALVHALRVAGRDSDAPQRAAASALEAAAAGALTALINRGGAAWRKHLAGAGAAGELASSLVRAAARAEGRGEARALLASCAQALAVLCEEQPGVCDVPRPRRRVRASAGRALRAAAGGQVGPSVQAVAGFGEALGAALAAGRAAEAEAPGAEAALVALVAAAAQWADATRAGLLAGGALGTLAAVLTRPGRAAPEAQGRALRAINALFQCAALAAPRSEAAPAGAAACVAGALAVLRANVAGAKALGGEWEGGG